MCRNAASPGDRARIVLFLINVAPRALEQRHGLSKSPGAIKRGIDPRVILQILAIDHRGPIDLMDGGFDFGVDHVHVAHHIGFVMHPQQKLRGAKIGARAQVARMASRRAGGKGRGEQRSRAHGGNQQLMSSSHNKSSLHDVTPAGVRLRWSSIAPVVKFYCG